MKHLFILFSIQEFGQAHKWKGGGWGRYLFFSSLSFFLPQGAAANICLHRGFSGRHFFGVIHGRWLGENNSAQQNLNASKILYRNRCVDLSAWTSIIYSIGISLFKRFCL